MSQPVNQIIGEEKGAVLVMVLLILVASVIIGVMSLNNATIETRIAGNERKVSQELNFAESAMELVREQLQRDPAGVTEATIRSAFATLYGNQVDESDLDVAISKLSTCPGSLAGECYVVTVNYGDQGIEAGIIIE